MLVAGEGSRATWAGRGIGGGRRWGAGGVIVLVGRPSRGAKGGIEPSMTEFSIQKAEVQVKEL